MTSENELILIFSGSEIEVLLLKEELEKAGISSMVKSDFNTGITAGFYGGAPDVVDLYILAPDLEKAQPIIKGFTETDD